MPGPRLTSTNPGRAGSIRTAAVSAERRENECEFLVLLRMICMTRIRARAISEPKFKPEHFWRTDSAFGTHYIAAWRMAPMRTGSVLLELVV